MKRFLYILYRSCVVYSVISFYPSIFMRVLSTKERTILEYNKQIAETYGDMKSVIIQRCIWDR